MSAAFQKGQAVQQVVTPIQGEILRFDFDPETGSIKYIVGWVDEQGAHERSFSAEELEAAAPAV